MYALQAFHFPLKLFLHSPLAHENSVLKSTAPYIIYSMPAIKSSSQRFSDSLKVWIKGIRFNGWMAAVLGIAFLVALPVLVVLGSVFADTGEVWSHLASTVLPQYMANSLWLMLGVSVGVLVIGVGTAWLVSLCRFPGRRLFEWGLLLPLAAPAYLLAYTYTDVLEYYGPVQTGLRSLFGWESATDYWFPNVRSIGGAIIMFSLTLYPYVYMLARVAFLEQSTRTLEASRSLGCGPWRSFFIIALPLARPSIIAGLSLALMETLNDFGTVQFFGVTTFTTGIYRTWFGMGERVAAAQLAATLMLFILALVLLEKMVAPTGALLSVWRSPSESFCLSFVRMARPVGLSRLPDAGWSGSVDSGRRVVEYDPPQLGQNDGQ